MSLAFFDSTIQPPGDFIYKGLFFKNKQKNPESKVMHQAEVDFISVKFQALSSLDKF